MKARFLDPSTVNARKALVATSAALLATQIFHVKISSLPTPVGQITFDFHTIPICLAASAVYFFFDFVINFREDLLKYTPENPHIEKIKSHFNQHVHFQRLIGENFLMSIVRSRDLSGITEDRENLLAIMCPDFDAMKNLKEDREPATYDAIAGRIYISIKDFTEFGPRIIKYSQRYWQISESKYQRTRIRLRLHNLYSYAFVFSFEIATPFIVFATAIASLYSEDVRLLIRDMVQMISPPLAPARPQP